MEETSERATEEGSLFQTRQTLTLKKQTVNSESEPMGNTRYKGLRLNQTGDISIA